jgi:hypothetical protein
MGASDANEYDPEMFFTHLFVLSCNGAKTRSLIML